MLTHVLARSLAVANCLWFSCAAWPPLACGVLLGALQLPAFFVVRGFVATSDAYQVSASSTSSKQYY